MSILATSVESFPFDNLMDWNIKAGIVGDQLSMKVWPDGAPEPALPQLVATDPTPLPNGSVFVGTWNNYQNSTSSFPLDASFDDIYLTAAVPEPCAVALVVAASLSVLGLRRARHHRNRKSG